LKHEVWLVRRHDPKHGIIMHSAWPDIYQAKFEAARWEQEDKVTHDYVLAEISEVVNEAETPEG
jgi:hypothetical protein